MDGIQVDGLSFSFPEGWLASKYDDWSFYRNQFSRMWNGIKSLDLLAVDPQKTGWLIEVKDYRLNTRTKPSDLGNEVAHKVFDTLAALVPARLYRAHAGEQAMAKALLGARKYRVVLHLEQPLKHSRLRPRAINPADIQLKLRQLLKPIDARPLVVEKSSMGMLAWRVTG
jgi:hypothetical protein